MDDLLIKAATVIAVALASFSSFPGTAQQQSPPAQQETPAVQQPSSNANGSNSARPTTGISQPPSAAAAQLGPVKGELVTKIDSKSAKQGDTVVVKTQEDVRFPGGAQIPKGSRLVGHVTNVQARGDGKENSQIAIQFDRAEMKDGQNMAIESVIQSVAPAPGDQTSDSGAGVPMAGSNTGTMANGANGSMAGSSNPRVTPNGSSQATIDNTRPGLASSTTAQPGATDQTTTNGVPVPGSIVARNGNVAIRATAVPGVLLANNIDGLPFTNASGIVLGARRDVRLDNGTQLVLAIAAAPQGAGSGMNR